MNDHESVRKSVTTGEYLDLCNRCYSTISDDVPTLETDVDHNESDFESEEGYVESSHAWVAYTDDEDENSNG